MVHSFQGLLTICLYLNREHSMAGRKIRVGIIGLGTISFVHEAGYSEMGDLCEIVAMCDLDAEQAASRAAFYNARAFTRYQGLLDDPNVDMVDVVVPHALHFEIALAAMEQGKHVLVEKPMAVHSEQGRRLIETAQKSGVQFGVAENTRFVTAYQKAQEILQEGILGDIWIVRTLIAGSEVYRIKDPSLWHGKAPYGGVILDSAVHSFYLFKWLFGGVKDVFGIASRIVPEGEVEDNGLILGHLTNGAEFQLHTSCTMEIPWTERLEIYGSQGGLIVDQLVDPVVKYYQGSNDIDGTAVEGVPFDPLAWKFNSIVAGVKDFVTAVVHGRAPLVDPVDALYTLSAVEAVQRSVQLGQPVQM
jgi:UDP-N-acetyl-2-amino-2-deoxyglucuronate dehydrogenase